MILDRKAEKYRKLLSNMDVIITNSETVQRRLYEFTGYESEIIYPPTDTSRFTPGDSPDPHDYFLSWARLSPPKRVDLIIDAFIEMPEQKLICTYGKNDPMREEIIAKIRDSKNITAIESPSDEALISLIQWARSSIYIPIEEDFGMSPVESMACGIPVIGADEGGLRETIIDSETGLLIDVSLGNLKEAIWKMTPAYAELLREKCRDRSEEFSLEKFEKRLRDIL